MNISKITLPFNINKNTSYNLMSNCNTVNLGQLQSVPLPITKGKNLNNNILNKDLFCKSSVSFGSSENNNDDLQLSESESYDSLSDSDFETKFNEKYGDLISEIKKYVNYERIVSIYIDALSSKKGKKSFMQNCLDIESFNNHLYSDYPKVSIYITDLLLQSGIKTMMSLKHFISVYSSNKETKETFSGQGIEAFKVYGILNNKNDLSNFPEILLFLYNEEQTKDNPDYEKLNTTTEFLKKLGIKNLKDFEIKYSYVASDYNNFESTADKIDAIEYMQYTYDDKIALLDEILKSNQETKTLDAEKVYKDNNSIIDYLYSQNNEQNLGNLEQYIDVLVQNPKLNQNSVKKIIKSDTPEARIDLYSLLKNCHVSSSEFNSLTSHTIVQNPDLLDYIVNYSDISELISKLKGINEKEGKIEYKNFKDIFNIFYKDENSDNFEPLLNIIDTFKLSDSDSFLKLYNKVYHSNKKMLKEEEIKDFIELLKYCDSSDIFNNAKKQNVGVPEFLTSQRNKTITVIDKIEKYIIEDETGYFAGQSPMEIYKEYKEQIAENPEEIPQTLQKIRDFDIEDSKEYKQKIGEIDEFSAFIPDRSTLLKFFNNNKFEFNDSEESKLYRNACLNILKIISDGSEQSKKRLDYYITSDFFIKSKKNLHSYMSSLSNQKEAFSLIADKKVPSITALKIFYTQYANQQSEKENLFAFLKSLPDDIDFEDAKNILSKLQRQIDDCKLPCKINNDNILSIDISSYKQQKTLSAEELNNLIVKMYNGSGNIITTLPNALNGKPTYFIDIKYKIAQELVAKLGKTSESYHNIEQILKIDKESLNLGDDCSDEIYAKAITQKIPDEFADFVRNNNWIKYDNEDKSKVPNMTLHARLRIIDRFALKDCETIEDLYSQETQEKLKGFIKSLYTSTPKSIAGCETMPRIIINTDYNSSTIESIFADDGNLITTVEKTQV